MPTERLLERLRSRSREGPGERVKDKQRLTQSILRHLHRILNTRWGCVPIAEDYGLPDFTDLAYTVPDSLKEIERAIKQIILKYEPRLETVRLSFVPQDEDMLVLHFQIVGKAYQEEERIPVTFDCMVDSDGKIMIRR